MVFHFQNIFLLAYAFSKTVKGVFQGWRGALWPYGKRAFLTIVKKTAWLSQGEGRY